MTHKLYTEEEYLVLLNALTDIAKGTLLDKHGNRDDNGLNAVPYFGPSFENIQNWSRIANEALNKASKIEAATGAVSEIKNNTTVKFKNISPGMFDDTMECTVCGFQYEDRADSSFTENTLNSQHNCAISVGANK